MVNGIKDVLKYAFTHPTQDVSKRRKGGDGVPNGWRGWCAGFVQNALNIGAAGDAKVMLERARAAGRLRTDGSTPPVGALLFYGGNSVAGTHVTISLGSWVELGTSQPDKPFPWDSNMTSIGIWKHGAYKSLPYVGWTDYIHGVGIIPTGEASGPEYFRIWQQGILREKGGYSDLVDNWPGTNTYRAIARVINYGPGIRDPRPGRNVWSRWVAYLGW